MATYDENLPSVATADGETSWEASSMSEAYNAYRQFAAERPLQIREYLPTTQALWATIFQLEMDWARNVGTILQASHPPTLESLKSLPEFSYADDPAFVVYLLSMQKVERVDDDDIEAGRDDFDERSTREKFLKRLRAEEEAAEGEGEDGQPERQKTKKEVMEEVIAKSKAFNDDDEETTKSPELPLVYIGSGTHRFRGVHQRFEGSAINPMLANAQWCGTSPSYQGLCTRDSWTEGVRRMEWLHQGLSEEEVEETRRLASREYKRAWWAEQGEELNKNRREKNRAKVADMIEGQLEEQRKNWCEKYRAKVANMTEEQLEEWRKNWRKKVADMTEEQREELNKNRREKDRARRANIGVKRNAQRWLT
ncbi:nucleolar complex protein 14 [Neurospora sp. IMI 360204]|nr:nucleolar complex protein 14 [Neurospora sp. IMI 360204]